MKIISKLRLFSKFTSMLMLLLLHYTSLTYAGISAEEEKETVDNTTSANKSISAKKYGEITGSVTLTSNYIWRGLSQTNNNPALQAELNYQFKGFYLKFFGSNVDFNDDNAHVETDPTIGYAHEFANGMGYNIGITRYIYPGAKGIDYNDAYFLVTYKIVYVSFAYSNNVFNSGNSGSYYEIGLDYPVPAKILKGIEGVSIGASAGYFQLPVKEGPSYSNYSLSIAKKLGRHLQLKLLGTATDGRYHNPAVDKPYLIGQVIVSF